LRSVIASGGRVKCIERIGKAAPAGIGEDTVRDLPLKIGERGEAKRKVIGVYRRVKLTPMSG